MKKGGVSWKKRYFILQGPSDRSDGPPRMMYYVKEEEKGKKVRGELELSAESRISDLPNKKSECVTTARAAGSEHWAGRRQPGGPAPGQECIFLRG